MRRRQAYNNDSICQSLCLSRWSSSRYYARPNSPHAEKDLDACGFSSRQDLGGSIARVSKRVGGRVGSNELGIGICEDGLEVCLEVALGFARAIGVRVSNCEAERPSGGHCQRCRYEEGGKNIASEHCRVDRTVG